MDRLLATIVKCITFFPLFVTHSDCKLDGREQQQRSVFEMKFIVPASGRYCFSQFVSMGETLTFEYAVVQSKVGQNMTLGFTLMDESNSNIMISVENRISLEVEELVGGEGGFELCYFNDLDSANDKTVIFYMNSFKPHNWDNTDAEISELNVVADTFKRSFDNTQDQILTAVKYILMFRLSESNDLALLESTFKYVNLWSLTHCVLIGLVGILQVYFVRTMIDGKTRTWTIFES